MEAEIKELVGNPMLAVGAKRVPCAQDELSTAIAEAYSRHNQPPDRTFDRFFSLVRDSVDGQAARKGYTDKGPDGDNSLFQFTHAIGADRGHSIGEIIYKAAEYMHEPREVLLIKICGWAYMLWRFSK